jgi:hypothetical protein
MPTCIDEQNEATLPCGAVGKGQRDRARGRALEIVCHRKIKRTIVVCGYSSSLSLGRKGLCHICLGGVSVISLDRDTDISVHHDGGIVGLHICADH